MDNNPQSAAQTNAEPTPQTILQTPLTNSPATKTSRTSPVTITLLLLFFWPLAFYLMWREKRYHIWIANILILLSLTSLLTVLLLSSVILPKLMQTYQKLEIQRNTNFITPQIIALTIASSQLIFGVFLRKKAGSPLPTPKLLLVIAIILIVVYNVSIVVSIYSIVTPIYTLTSEIGTNY